MNCERVKELLLTDYSDGLLSVQWQHEIQAHLGHCPECKALAQEIDQRAIAPFKTAKTMKLDERVWLQLKEKIQPTPHENVERINPFEFIFNLVNGLKPALALTLLVFVMGGVTGLVMNQPSQVATNINVETKQENYLAYLMDTDASSQGDLTDSIEQYFL